MQVSTAHAHCACAVAHCPPNPPRCRRATGCAGSGVGHWFAAQSERGQSTTEGWGSGVCTVKIFSYLTPIRDTSGDPCLHVFQFAKMFALASTPALLASRGE